MKKLVATFTALMMTVILSVSASAATSPENPITPIGGVAGFNQSANDYLTYARTVRSYIEETDNGFRRIEYYDSKLVVEEYDSSFTLTFRKTINKTSYIFGGYYQGSDYCYLVWGKTNPEESDDQEVLLIEKWTKGIDTRVSTVSVYGANTYIPFDAGSLRMTETAGKLYIHTCHEMYMTDDGYHHQANMTFVVNTSTMTVVDSWYDVMNIGYGYVSHSFNQFIKTDGTYIYRADHGDAYPRSVVITKCAVGGDITNVSYTDALTISGAIGDNFTGVGVGGFEMTADNLLIAGNTADQSGGYISYNSMRNIFVTVTDKNLSSTTVKYLTHYTSDDDVEVCTPHLVKINDNKFLVMWEELKDYTIYTRLCTIDGEGNQTSAIVDTYMLLSDCAPVLFSDGLVYWFKSDTSGATLYRVNPDDLEAANNDYVPDATTVKLVSTGKNTVTLGWTAVEGAKGYSVRIYSDGEWGTAAYVSEDTTEFEITDLSQGTEYKFKVLPNVFIYNTAVYGKDSNIVQATTSLDTVSNFKSQNITTTEIGLSWTKNAYATGNIIEQYDGSKWIQIADVKNNSSSYTVKNLTPGTAYKFRIKTYTASKESSYTSALTATTQMTELTGFASSGVSTTSIRLAWTKNDYATSYIIERYSGTKWVQVTNITNNATTSYNVTGLTPGTTYQFRMKACTASAESSYTATLTISTQMSETTGFTSPSKSTTAIRLSWTKNAYAAGYIIEQYDGSKWVQIADITDNATVTYKVTDLTPGTTYKFRMKSYNAVDESGYTSTLTVNTQMSEVKGFKSPSKSTTAIRLGWTKNAYATGYIIEQYDGSKWVQIADITDTTVTEYKVANLAPGTAYKFRMRAYSVTKYGETIDGEKTATITVNTQMSEIKDFAGASKSATTINLSWTKNAYATGYIIEQYDGSKWVQIADITDNKTVTYKVTDLIPGTAYKFRMRAYSVTKYGETINGDKTTTITINTDMTEVKGFKSPSKSTTAIRLGWTKNAYATGYIIEQYDGSKWVQIADITDNKTVTYKVTGLVPGTAYKFRMRAYSVTKYGETIDGDKTATLTVNTQMTAVKDFAGTSKSTSSIDLSWTKNAYADGYIIEQYDGSAWTQIADITKGSTTTYKITGLKAGTAYKFRMKAYSVTKYDETIYGDKTATITVNTQASAVKDFALKSRSSTALRLKWTKNTAVDGYIIEQYDGTKWVQIVEIEGNATTEYKVTGLKASTKYKFRMKSYVVTKYDEKTYSAYTSVLTKTTNPSVVSGLTVKSKAQTAIRLAWEKNTSATGYLIEQYKDGKWVQVAKIESNATLNYRIDGLTKATTYKFRMRTYNMVGTTALYSEYKTISATTNS